MDDDAIHSGTTDIEAANDRPAYDQAIRAERSGTRIGLVVFAVSASVWLLLQTGWLPESFANILEGPRDQIARGTIWLTTAVMGIGIAGMSYLDLRALRRGTALARKQAHVAKLIAGTAGALFCVALVGLMLVLLGIVINNWLTGGPERFPYFVVNYLAHIPIIFVIWGIITWTDRPIRTTAELIFALVVLGALLAADIAVGGFMVWDGLQIAEERELPVWIAFMRAAPNLVVALYLFLGMLAPVRRLRVA